MKWQQEEDWEAEKQEGAWDDGKRGALATGGKGGGRLQQLGSTTLGAYKAFKFPTSYLYGRAHLPHLKHLKKC